jgi:hypothetical protein
MHSNLGTLSSDIISISRSGIDLETDMTVFLSTALYPPIPMHDRPDSLDIVFGVWVSLLLIGLAIVSVALGVAPLADPPIFSVP